MARKPLIKRIKAHVRKDNRYTRTNRVLMTKCPICSSKSLSEFREMDMSEPNAIIAIIQAIMKKLKIII